jgi:preprotein translocase subunit YajC
VIIYLLVFVVIAFMLWTTYSQQRRSKKAQEQLQRMVKKGDEVLTVGGMFGTVRKVGDDFVILEVADRTKVRFLRRSIREIVNEEEDVEEDDEAEYVDDEYDEAEYDEQGDDDDEGSDEEEYDEEDSDDEADESDEAEQEGDGQELSAEAGDDAVDAPADSVRAPEPPTPPKGS